MIVYEIEPTQTDYLLQEDIKVKLRIENQGTETVEVPDPRRAANSQPVYGLAGPAVEQPMMFSNWTRQGNGEPPPLQMMPMGPGETWTGESRLNRLVRIERPGEYRLGSMLAWQNERVRAADRTFRLHRPDPVSLHIGQGERPFQHGQGQIVFLQRETGGTGVYAIQFTESDPSNSEVEMQPALRWATAGTNATDVLSPWTNTQLFDDLLQWIVWREGRTLRALSSAEKTASSYDFPVEPNSLVRPPLQAKGGPVEVLAVKGKSLTMVSIAPKLGSVPALAWSAELPAAPTAITAALGSVANGSARHIAFAVRQGNGTELFHGEYAAEGLGAMERVAVADVDWWDGAPLTMVIDGDGVAHVAVLGRRDKGLTLVEARFGKGKAEVGQRELPEMEQAAGEGAIVYVVEDGAIVRREIVVAGGGDVWNLSQSGKFRKLAPRRNFVSPLRVVPGLELSYVLYQNAAGAIQFEALHR